MAAYLVRRLAQAAFVLLLVSFLVFMGVYAIGDPVQMLVPPDATAAEVERARVALGLDQPILVQYWLYLTGLFQGDLGTSFVYNQPTIDLVLQRLPATVELGLAAFVMSLVIGLPLGLIAGYRAGSVTDDGIMNGSIFAYSLPNFWQGLLLILLFAVQLRWFPSGGRGDTGTFLGIETSLVTASGWSHIFLPAFNLALFNAAMVIRLTRAQVQAAMNSEYVRYARAKGIPEGRILMRHAFRNVLIPLVTVLGLELGNLLAYGIITETVFNWPGMGQLLINSINVVDRPVIVGYLLIVVAMFVVINLLVDITYTLLDPRIRLGAMPSNIFFDRASQQEFSAFLGGFGTTTGSAIRGLQQVIATNDPEAGTGGFNRTRFSDPEFDSLVAQAAQTFEEAERDALLAQATVRAFTEQQAIIPLHFEQQIWALRKGLTYDARPIERTLAQDIRPAE